MNDTIKTRLEYFRKQIENESMSYGEIAELQSLAEHIDKNDTLLLQWAGVKEFKLKKEDKEYNRHFRNKEKIYSNLF